jgi:hypothetical protein
MGFAHGFATGTQVGNSWLQNYRDAKLKAGLAAAGNFSPTEVASGEEALTAAEKAKQFQIGQISADDPDFASKYKQVQDDFAPTMSGLEAQRAKGASQMVQLPGGRRIEQDEAFSPEQMAGLRAEQASKVYAQQGYPEEAAKSTLASQGIVKGKQDIEKNSMELKALKRTEAQHDEWAAEDAMHKDYLNPDTPVAEKDKYRKTLMNKVLPMIDGNNPYLPGVIGKSVSKDGKSVTIEENGATRIVPVTDALIQKAHMLAQLARDPKMQAEYHMKMQDRVATEAGLDKRAEGNNRTQLQVGRENNASAEKVAGIRAAALQTRGGGAGGVPGLTPELNQQRIAEMQAIEDDHTLTSAQKDDQMNRVQLKYNAKASQLREPNPAKVGLKDGLSSDGLTLTMDGKVYNRSMDGRSWEPVQMPNESGEEVRYDAQGNAWVKGPDGKPVRKQ